MFGQSETGYDYSSKRGWGTARTSKEAQRLIFALIIGALAGVAIMLQIRGWGTLGSEAGGACGTSRYGVNYGPCPRGTTPALIVGFAVGLPAVPLAVALAFRKGWTRRGLLAVGVAGGLLAGQSLFGIWHGSDLTIAWTAPLDSSSDLNTVGAWVNGGSLVRVRTDEVVSYDGVTGRPKWTLPLPGTDVACSVSNDTGTGGTGTIGLVMYGQDSTSCDHVMAVGLATGRQLWAIPLQSSYSGDSALGVLGLASGTAVVLTDDGILGLDARSGAQRWTETASECDVQDLAGSGGTAIALVDCSNGSYYVVSLDPATGKVAWQYHVTEPSDSYQFQILSVSPLVISDNLTGPRGTAEVRVFGPGGAVTATFPVSGIPDPAASGPLTLDTDSTDGFGIPEVIDDGALVGVAKDDNGHSALVAFGLSSGQRQWVIPLPDEVNDITVGGSAQRSEVVLVDESDPAYSLEEVDVANGKLRSLGFFGQQALQSGDSGLYTVGNEYLVVNLDGSADNPPIAAIKAPAATG